MFVCNKRILRDFPQSYRSQARARGFGGKLPPGLQALSLIQPQQGRLVYSVWALGVRAGWGMTPPRQGPCPSSHFVCKGEAYVGRAPAAGERPRCTKVASQHFLTHGPSDTRRTLPCWHISTHTHHVHILVDMATHPRTHLFTVLHSHEHLRPSCTDALSMSLTAPDKYKSGPPALNLSPTQILQE